MLKGEVAICKQVECTPEGEAGTIQGTGCLEDPGNGGRCSFNKGQAEPRVGLGKVDGRAC